MQIDPNGVILSANSTACRLFGYENDELNGRQAQVILPDCDHRKAAFGALEVLRSDPDLSNTTEAVGLKKNDTEFPVEVVMMPCDQGYICQLRDISRRQMSESMDAILHATLRRVLRGQTYEQFCSFLCEKIVELLGSGKKKRTDPSVSAPLPESCPRDFPQSRSVGTT